MSCLLENVYVSGLDTLGVLTTFEDGCYKYMNGIYENDNGSFFHSYATMGGKIWAMGGNEEEYTIFGSTKDSIVDVDDWVLYDQITLQIEELPDVSVNCGCEEFGFGFFELKNE